MAEQTEFEVKVVKLTGVSKHPNADSLSLVTIEGKPVVFRTADFAEGDTAIYIPVDALVPTSRPEFAFLAKPGVERHRIRAMRLRGIFSMISDTVGDVWFEGDGAEADREIDLWTLAEGKSLLAAHTREGAVVKPTAERVDPFTGRVALKLVGQGYLLRSEAA